MRVENGIAFPEGDLTMDHASQAVKEGTRLLEEGVSTFDLSGLAHVDSATLSLLMNWRRFALARGSEIKFTNTPENLLGLARLYGVTDLVKFA